jgi:hypothetical protein
MKSSLIAIAVLLSTSSTFAVEKHAHTESRDASFTASYSVQDVIRQAVAETPPVARLCAPIFDNVIGNPYVITGADNLFHSKSGFGGQGTNLFDVFLGIGIWTSVTNPKQRVLGDQAAQKPVSQAIVFPISASRADLSPLQNAKRCVDIQVAAAKDLLAADLSKVASFNGLVDEASDLLIKGLNKPSDASLRDVRNTPKAFQYRFVDDTIISADAPPEMTVTVTRYGAVLYSKDKIGGVDYKISLKKSGGAVVVQ